MARFFEALVVAGAGLSLSGYACGGKSLYETGDDSPGSSGSGGASGSAGNPPIGGAGVGAGGNAGTSYGGSYAGDSYAGSSYGGSTYGGSAGDVSATAGTTGMIPPPEVAAQWSCYTPDLGPCDARSTNYLYEEYSLSAPCQVDLTRPRRASDCGGEMFSCVGVQYLGADILVNCQCIMPDTTCSCVNYDGSYGSGICYAGQETCYCAYAGILK